MLWTRLLPLVLITGVALGARLLVVWHTREMGLFADMQDYHDRAVHLLNTGTLARDAFRVPGYPIFIAGVFKAGGQSLLALRVVQAILGAATVALTYVVARRVVSERGAIAAAAIVAFYPALLLYSAFVMSEVLFTFLVVLAAVLWMRERAWTALCCGLVVGAATLTRSVGLALLAGIAGAALLAVWKRSMPLKRAVAHLALLAIGFAVALAPWVQRNYAVYQRFIPTETSTGFNALLGNYPGATGRHPGLPAVESAWNTYWQGARNDLERSEIGLRVAREYVMSEPRRAAALALRKAGYLFGVEGREHAWAYSHHVQGRRSAVTVWMWGIAIMASFPLLMTLATVGLIRPGATHSDAGLLTVTALVCAVVVHVASFGDSRFHLPWIPFLAVFAARALDVDSALSPARRAMATVCVIALALLWASQLPELLNVLPQLAASPAPLQLPY